MPRLEINASPSNFPYLTNSDGDLHMPSDINFIATIAHMNFIIIRRLTIASERVIPFLRYIATSLTSLAKNFDSLLNMLKGLHGKCSVIGLAEIKFQFD